MKYSSHYYELYFIGGNMQNDSDYENFLCRLSNTIVMLKKQNSLSDSVLAQRLHITKTELHLIETGKIQPTINQLITLSNIFQMTVHEFMLLVEEKKNIMKEAQVEYL